MGAPPTCSEAAKEQRDNMRAIKFDHASKALLFAAVATALLTSGSVFAQGVGAMSTPQDDETPGAASVTVAYGHLFESDTDNGGNVSRDNAMIDIRSRSAINEDMGFTVVGGYEFAGYDFGGALSPARFSESVGPFVLLILASVGINRAASLARAVRSQLPPCECAR
jgi:hypothetical protein